MAKLYFYFSSMNAGKSTLLLQSSYNYQERGMATIIFTPAIDDRYGTSKVASRIGLKSAAVSFDEDMNLLEYVKASLKENPKIKCILVDEAQFLSKEQVRQLSDIPDFLKIPVLCYGLRTNFRGELFTGSQYLLAWADELTEIKTICHCGSKATMVLRIDENNQVTDEGENILIGGNDRYASTCRKHHKLKIVERCDSSTEKLAEPAE